MSNSPFSSFYHILNVPAFKEESTYGVIPSGSYTFIAPQAAFIPEFDVGAITTRVLGSRDVRTIVDGAHIGGFTLRFNPYNTTFLKYAFNTGSGTGSVTGTIDTSFTVVSRIRISGSNYMMYIPGAKIENCTVSAGVGGLVQAEAYCVGLMPTLSGSDTPGGVANTVVSWPTDPGTDPYSFKDGGANPLTVNSVGYNVNRIRCAVRNNLTPIYVMGNQDPIQLMPMERQTQLVFTKLQDGIFAWNLATGSAYHALNWKIKSGTATIILSGSKLTRLLNLPYVVGAVATETWGAECTGSWLVDA